MKDVPVDIEIPVGAPVADGETGGGGIDFRGAQTVGIKEVEEGIWLVSFMNYDLGYVDLEEKTLQPLANPFGPKV
jgi:hypothetical protein